MQRKYLSKLTHLLLYPLSELEIDGNYLNQIKVLINDEIMNDFPLRLKTRRGCLLLTFIQHYRWHDYVHNLQITIKNVKLENLQDTRSIYKNVFLY